MIFYNSLLAKWFLGKGKKHYFMLGWFFFTRYKYLEVWEDMELRIHAKQYWECFSLTLIPALILSLLFSWWCMILPFITYDFRRLRVIWLLPMILPVYASIRTWMMPVLMGWM